MLAEHDNNNNPERYMAEIRVVANESTRIQELRKQAQINQEYQQLQKQ